MNALGKLIIPLLGVTLVILKALGAINLAWVWVLAPFWAPLVLVLPLIPLIIILVIIGVCLDDKPGDFMRAVSSKIHNRSN